MAKEVILGIRPEDIHDEEVVFEAYPDAIVELTVDVSELLGADTNIYATMDGYPVTASVDARDDLVIGSKVKLALDMNKCHFFDAETELVIK